MAQTPQTTTPGTLAVSSAPLASQALKAGGEARLATAHAAFLRDLEAAMAALHLPANPHERRLTVAVRLTRLRDAEAAEKAADEADSAYEHLMAQLWEIAPAVAEAVTFAVWGEQQQ